MLFGAQYTPERKDTLDAMRKFAFAKLIELKQNIVIDATNLNPAQEIYYRRVIDEHNEQVKYTGKGEGYTFRIKDFTNVSIGECLSRNRLRQFPVPEKAIYDMYNQFLRTEKQHTKQDDNLKHCIIVDIDGTMSITDGRSPFDMSKVYQDATNPGVVTMVRTMDNALYKIIFITGRDESARANTVKWLADKAHIKPGYELYMRPDGDARPDTEYKKDLYNEVIKDKYYVVFWIEDRWRLVQMVREDLGLTCLQCANGFF